MEGDAIQARPFRLEDQGKKHTGDKILFVEG